MQLAPTRSLGGHIRAVPADDFPLALQLRLAPTRSLVGHTHVTHADDFLLGLQLVSARSLGAHTPGIPAVGEPV